MSLPVETVTDYPRPPALERVPQMISVVLGGVEIVRSERGLRVLETHHAPTYYVPPGDVTARLVPAGRGSVCEWKGRARYVDVEAGGRTARAAAWCYDRPTARFAALAGHLAFYAGRMEACRVGDVAVLAQDGDFYGGWVTPNLRGIVKGGPGTEGW